MNINQASARLQLTPFYVRKCIKKETLHAKLVLVSDDSEVRRYEITEEAIEEFEMRERKSVGKREDGRNKFNIYLTPVEYAKLSAILVREMSTIAPLLKRANKHIAE